MRRPTQRNVRRIAAAKILFAALFLAVGGRAIQLQLWEGDRLMRLGQRQHLKEWIVSIERKFTTQQRIRADNWPWRIKNKHLAHRLLNASVA